MLISIDTLQKKPQIRVTYIMIVEHGGNRRGGTSVYIRCCYRMGVMCCPLFYKSQKCGEGGKHLYHCWPLHPVILNFGDSEDAGVNIS
jgi:hypothetical protein